VPVEIAAQRDGNQRKGGEPQDGLRLEHRRTSFRLPGNLVSD
jgi:hypothetical protein